MRTKLTIFETKLNRVLAEAGTKFIRAYHITTVDIPRFDPKYIKDIGFHFAENIEQCFDHIGIMEMENPILITVDLYINNPLITNDICYWDETPNLQNLRTGDEQINQLMPTIETPQDLVKLATKLGYDSIQYNNEYEGGGTAYLVWDTSKIKIIKKQRVDIDDDTGEPIYL